MGKWRKAANFKKIVADGKDDKSLKETYETIVKFNAGRAKAASTGKKTATELANTITKILKLAASVSPVPTTAPPNPSVPTSTDGEMSEVKIAAKKASFKVPEWLKIIPKVGPVISVLDFLITGTSNKKTATGGSTLIKTSGSLKFKSVFKSTNIVVPGAQKGTAVEQLVPKYNNPLGVFNLVETPELEYVEYQPNVKTLKYATPAGSLLGVVDMPTIREYIVSKNLVYTLNPHANVEIVNMDVSLVYTPKVKKIPIPCDNDKPIVTPSTASIYGPVEFGDYNPNLSYENRLFAQDIILNYGSSTLEEGIEGAIYSTPVKSPHCFKKTRFKVFHWDNLGETEIKCKIMLTLKPKDSDEAFLMIHSYPVKIKVSSQNLIPKTVLSVYEPPSTEKVLRKYYFKNLKNVDGKDYALIHSFTTCQTNFPIARIDPSPFSANGYHYPSNVFISDRHFTQDEEIKAWNSIVIGKNVTADPNVKLTVQAGKSIHFLTSANMDFDFETILEEPESCPVVNTASLDRINQLCRSSKYKDLSILKRELKPVDDLETKIEVDFKSYPVPFKDNISLEFSLSDNAIISLIITNVLGQELERLIDKREMSSGDHQINYDGNQLASGIYYATIQSKTFKKTIKLIKQ